METFWRSFSEWDLKESRPVEWKELGVDTSDSTPGFFFCGFSCIFMHWWAFFSRELALAVLAFFYYGMWVSASTAFGPSACMMLQQFFPLSKMVDTAVRYPRVATQSFKR